MKLTDAFVAAAYRRALGGPRARGRAYERDRHRRQGPPSSRAGVLGSILAAVRAILLGMLILMVGGSLSGALMFVNLKMAPTLPLFLPATVLWLWLFWRYVSGDGWPQSTSASRRDLLRVRKLSPRAWGWALVAGGLGLAAVMGIAFMTYRFATLPDAAYQAPFDVASFPPWTLVSIFAAVAFTAAVVEEAAFRGYMLSGIQAEYGWWGQYRSSHAAVLHRSP